MPSQNILLTYATAPLRPRHFHIYLLPLIWLPAGIGSRFYAHDFGYLLVFLPAVPLFTFPPNHLGMITRLNVALAFTLLVVIGVGHLLDRARAPRWIHFIFPPILLLAIVSRIFVANFRTGLQSIPPPPLPGPWHPSNLFPAWASTLYLFAFAVMFLTPLIRTFFRGDSVE